MVSSLLSAILCEYSDADVSQSDVFLAGNSMVSVSGKILFVSLIDALEAESIGFISKRWSKEVLSTSSAQKINGPLWIANALMFCETNGLVHMERVGCSKETSKSACPDTLTTAKPYSLTT